MSLINRVLQDLENRGAGQPDAPQIAEQIRPVAAPASRNRRGLAVWLLVLCGAAVAAFSLWSGSAPFRDSVNGLLAGIRHPSPVGTTALVPAKLPESPPAVRAQVEAALMVPVFQLSDELTMLPADVSRRAPSPADAQTVAAVKPASKPVVKPQATVPQKNVAASNSAPNSNRKTGSAAAPQKQPEPKPPTVSKTDVASKASSAPKKANAITANKRDASESIEEIVIPANLSPQPIEKQARRLTAYERAENAFRQGVASLRRGRMAEAEAHFRAAITEDRSHGPAQQALLGVLLEAGRFEDAEHVLAESLSVNPRQPNQAIILARLKVERGDLAQAIKTLESVSAYAGTDARYLSFLAAVLQRAEMHEQAVVQYRNALALMPRTAVWWMGLGISLRALGENTQAQQAFGSAAAIGTLNTDLQAFVQQQQRELKRAVN